MEFLIFACVIISWPLRMPPRRRPMMTSTMAISTRVKPLVRLMRLPAKKSPAASERAAERVDVGAGFGVRRGRSPGGDIGVRAGLRLAAHRTGVDLAVVHLRIERDRHFVGNVGRADDHAGKASQRRSRARIAGLYTDHSGEGVEGLVEAGPRHEA